MNKYIWFFYISLSEKNSFFCTQLFFEFYHKYQDFNFSNHYFTWKALHYRFSSTYKKNLFAFYISLSEKLHFSLQYFLKFLPQIPSTIFYPTYQKKRTVPFRPYASGALDGFTCASSKARVIKKQLKMGLFSRTGPYAWSAI